MKKFLQNKIALVPSLYATAFILYSGIKIIHTVNLLPYIYKSADTGVYIRMASLPIFSSNFLGGPRPFTVPLLYKIFDSNFILIASIQSIFSIFCWGFLALQVSKTVKLKWLKSTAFAFILLFSLSENIIGWDSVMLSESISLSLMILFIACWLWLLNSWKWQKVVLLITVAFFWTFSRETNAWIILFIAGIILVLTVWNRYRKRYLFIALIFILFFISNEISSNTGRRWIFPFLNTLSQRILPYKENITFFSNNGMPISSALTRMSGKWASREDRAYYKDPALKDFRSWLYENGKSSYLKWLLSKPYNTLKEPISNREQLLTFESRNYFASGFHSLLPAFLDKLIYPRYYFFLTFLSFCILILIITYLLIFRKFTQNNPVLILLFSIILLLYPHAFLIWHGDAMEIGRHSVQLAAQFYFSIWFSFFLIFDYILDFNLMELKSSFFARNIS